MIKKWDEKLILDVFVNDKIITFPSSHSETPVSSVSNFTSLLLFQGNQSFGLCEYLVVASESLWTAFETDLFLARSLPVIALTPFLVWLFLVTALAFFVEAGHLAGRQ